MACEAVPERPGPDSLRELLENHGTGLLVSPGDSEGIAVAITSLLEDRVLRDRLSRNAAEDARRQFGLDRQVEACLDWYQAILER